MNKEPPDELPIPIHEALPDLNEGHRRRNNPSKSIKHRKHNLLEVRLLEGKMKQSVQCTLMMNNINLIWMEVSYMTSMYILLMMSTKQLESDAYFEAMEEDMHEYGVHTEEMDIVFNQDELHDSSNEHGHGNANVRTRSKDLTPTQIVFNQDELHDSSNERGHGNANVRTRKPKNYG
uniref:Uncharacterized protein n=1 Tax=Setaria italica TaxID=4555 RepID=K3YD41_SETIT